MAAAATATEVSQSPSEGSMLPYTLAIGIRPYRATDRNLVLVSYLRSYWSSRTARTMKREDYFKTYEEVVRERLMPASYIVCAHLAEDEDAVVGWRMEAPTGELHYLFTKMNFRNQGVARRLLAEGSGKKVYTHKTFLCDGWKTLDGWEFDSTPAVKVMMGVK